MCAHEQKEFVLISWFQSYKLKKTLKRENSAICCLCAPPVDDKIWIGTDKCILILDYKVHTNFIQLPQNNILFQNQTIIQELEGHSSMVNGIKVVGNTIWSCSAGIH